MQMLPDGISTWGKAMNRNTPIRRMNIARGACACFAWLLLSCVSDMQPIVPAKSSGGAGGNGATNTTGSAGSGGASDLSDAAAVSINLDVAPVWWGTADAPQGPEVQPTPTADANCGNMTSKTTRRPVDVVLVLDRSESMEWVITDDCACSTTTVTAGPGPGRGDLGGIGRTCAASVTDCTTRWEALRPALTTTLSTSTYVNWGLKFFPSPGSSATCYEDTAMDVPISTTSTSEVVAQVNGATFALGTPTTAALAAATEYLKTLDDGNDKFILLATDGQPNCASPPDIGQADVTGSADACAAAFAADIKVFVVGIGPKLDVLTQLAQAGGTTDYFPVGSPEELVDALSSISKLVGSCNFESAEPPPDEDNVAVYVNGQRVDQDADNGWTFGSSSQEIVLTGDYCAGMSTGDQADVQILFGCPGQQYFPPNIY